MEEEEEQPPPRPPKPPLPDTGLDVEKFRTEVHYLLKGPLRMIDDGLEAVHHVAKILDERYHMPVLSRDPRTNKIILKSKMYHAIIDHHPDKNPDILVKFHAFSCFAILIPQEDYRRIHIEIIFCYFDDDDDKIVMLPFQKTDEGLLVYANTRQPVLRNRRLTYARPYNIDLDKFHNVEEANKFTEDIIRRRFFAEGIFKDLEIVYMKGPRFPSPLAGYETVMPKEPHYIGSYGDTMAMNGLYMGVILDKLFNYYVVVRKAARTRFEYLDAALAVLDYECTVTGNINYLSRYAFYFSEELAIGREFKAFRSELPVSLPKFLDAYLYDSNHFLDHIERHPVVRSRFGKIEGYHGFGLVLAALRGLHINV